VYRWDTATVTGNTIFATEDPTGSTDEFIAVIETRNPAASVWNNNVYYDETEGGGNTSFWVGDFSKWWEVSYANWKSRSGFDQNTQYQRGRPTGTKVVVLPNKYGGPREYRRLQLEQRVDRRHRRQQRPHRRSGVRAAQRAAPADGASLVGCLRRQAAARSPRRHSGDAADRTRVHAREHEPRVRGFPAHSALVNP